MAPFLNFCLLAEKVFLIFVIVSRCLKDAKSMHSQTNIYILILGCADECSTDGLDQCHGAAVDDCCNFYLNDSCVIQCPTNYIALPPDYNCGKYN